MKIKLTLTLTITALAGLAPGASGQAIASMRGELDPSFGEGGRVVRSTPSGGGTYNRTQTAQAPDGTIYALFYGDLLALKPNGEPDQSFGEEGVVSVAHQVPYLSEGQLAVDSSGRPVVAGTVPSREGSLALIRYLPDGAPDPSFGSGGVLTTDLGLGQTAAEWPTSDHWPSFLLNEMAIDRFNRFVLTGGHLDGFDLTGYRTQARYRGLVARLQPSGEIDGSYGEAGVFLGFPSDTAATSSLASDGSLFAATQIGGVGYVVHLTADGALDSGFGADGRRRLPDGPTNLVADGRGGVVVWGPAKRHHRELVIRRLRSDGSFGPHFGLRGVARIDFRSRTAARLIAPDHAGGFFLASEWGLREGEESGARAGFLLARLTSRGHLDKGFGSIKTGFGADTRAKFPSLAVDRRGRPLLAGVVVGPELTGFGNLAIVRYRKLR